MQNEAEAAAASEAAHNQNYQSSVAAGCGRPAFHKTEQLRLSEHPQCALKEFS